MRCPTSNLLIHVEDASFAALWRGRRRYVREMLPLLYVSEETRNRQDTGVVRVLTADGVAVELAFFAERAPFRLARPYRVLFDRGGALCRMPRMHRPARAPMSPLPAGVPDLPFALQDIAKRWIRGHRREALRLLHAVAREVYR